MNSVRPLLAAIVVGVIVLQGVVTAEDTPNRSSPSSAVAGSAAPTGAVRGLWVWRRQSIKTPEARAALIAFCRTHGFNRLLVQIHTTPESRSTGKPQLALPDALAALLADAAGAGVVVEALDGAKDMALRENWDNTLAMLEAILAFNRARPAGQRFAGMHYDIEPYILPAWKTHERQRIMADYLGFLALARQKVDAEGYPFLLSADIPMWYDRKTEPGDSCAIEFNGATKNLHEHVQDLTDYVGIMSYRRHATGENSVVAHCEAELAYAGKVGKTVCPALETVELKDSPQITFFGQDPAKLWETKGRVEAALADHAGFGGIFVHSYEGLRALVESGAARAE